MNLTLRPDVHYCIANGRPCFLDLAEDRYYCLPDDAGQLFVSIANGLSDPEALRDVLAPTTFVRLFDLRCDADSLRVDKPSAPAQSSLTDRAFAKPDWPTAALAGMAYLNAGRMLRQAGIKTVLTALKFRKLAPRKRRATQTIEEIAGNFLRTKRLLATHDQCLRWSIAMATFLEARGHTTELVVGVKMKPFGAHAWVQHDAMVLSDALDNVLPYTPIVVI